MMNDERIVRTIRTYDSVAEKYAEVNNKQGIISNIEPFRKYFVKNIPGRKVLDVGCGHGRDARYFTNHGLEVIGIDLSRELLGIAGRTAPNAVFHEMDMICLSDYFKPGFFDGLWVMSSFLHVPEEYTDLTLKGFQKVLKHDGLAFICVKEGSYEGFQKSSTLDNHERFFKNYLPEDFKALISRYFGIIDFKITGQWLNIFAKPVKK